VRYPLLTTPHTAAAAIFRRWIRARSGIFRAPLLVPFDADNGKYDHGRGLFRAAKTYNPPIIGELNNGAHAGAQPQFSACQAENPLPRCTLAPALLPQVSRMQG